MSDGLYYSVHSRTDIRYHYDLYRQYLKFSRGAHNQIIDRYYPRYPSASLKSQNRAIEFLGRSYGSSRSAKSIRTEYCSDGQRGNDLRKKYRYYGSKRSLIYRYIFYSDIHSVDLVCTLFFPERRGHEVYR